MAIFKSFLYVHQRVPPKSSKSSSHWTNFSIETTILSIKATSLGLQLWLVGLYPLPTGRDEPWRKITGRNRLSNGLPPHLWIFNHSCVPSNSSRVSNINQRSKEMRQNRYDIILMYSILKMDGANFRNAPSVDHLRDGMFCAIYRLRTHVVETNLFSSSRLV